ncbi:MAG: hypothetical protein OEY94_05725 [Alphaproteobacteria bacterium]|nr:hypothetical protein [Alphaproteobacteria bacterium]
MLLDIHKLLEEIEIKDPVYPGKRSIKPCKQTGEFKSHCVVMDWHNPDTLFMEVKAGLSGKAIDNKDLKKYPVCLQMPTYVKIEIVNDNDDKKEDEEGKGKKGKSDSSSGGGKKLAKKKLKDIVKIAQRFGEEAEGKIPSAGKIVEMMVMGMKVAEDAFSSVFNEIVKQIKASHIAATELLAKAGDIVTRVQPPSFLKPKGDETVKYNYDREKNANIGFRPKM